MKKLINCIRNELLWWISVFGIDQWKIFCSNRKEFKRDLITFINCLIMAWIISCAISFLILTSLENSKDAIFWWTTGMFSAIVYTIFGGFSFSNK